jgi:uncharacterized repeat protein (TIGR01451 family)
LLANASASLDQCANDPAPSPNSNGCNSSASQWVNGNLGASKSSYFEGDSIPYRLTFGNLSIGPTHTVTIEWDTTKSSTHALDYIDSFNQSVLDANACLGVSGCNPASFTTFAIPADPQVTGAGVTPVAGQFTIYGGTITGLTCGTGGRTGSCDPGNPYFYANGTGFSGDKSASITLQFTASVANPVLAWGGHISTRKNWGQNNSAVAIPGSPYHTRLIELDGSGGNQDRSLSAAAVTFPGSITIIKDATPNGSTSFQFTASPSPLTNFSLVDDGTAANTKAFTNITNFQTYTITEGPIPAGWGFDSASCTVTSPNGGSFTAGQTTTINMQEGENYTCTYQDSLRTGALIVKKHVINDNGGTANAGAFNLHVKSGGSDVTGSPAAGSETGTTYTLVAGTYAVSEDTPLSGYAFTGFSGDCNSSGSVTVTAGATVTCTLTNDDQAPALHLRKVVINDNGGTALATDWTLTATGPTSLSGTTPVDSGSGFSAGTYSLSESGPSGYSTTGYACVGGTQSGQSITLGLGQSATCTITNDDIAPQLIVIKHVINDNGGTAVAGDFTMTVAATNVKPSASFPGAESPGTTVSLDAGSFSVSEASVFGYTQTSAVGCSGTIAVGQTKTCTITNDDIAPQLVLVKQVVNTGGGTAATTDFTTSAAGTTTPISGAGGVSSVAVYPLGTFQAGTYTLSETNQQHYAPGTYSCTGSAQGFSQPDSTHVALGVGGSATCTVTNTFVHLTIQKSAAATTIHPGDTASFTITVTNDSDGDATGVTLTDLLPDATQLSWGVSTSSNWGSPTTTCSIAAGVLTCGPVTLAHNAAHNATATVTVTATVPANIFGSVGPPNGDPLPTGLFQLDRNALQSLPSTPPATDDWDNVLCPGLTCDASEVNKPGPGGGSTVNTGVVSDNTTLNPLGSLGSQFTTGSSKDISDITTWLWKPGEPLDKDDITNAYAAGYVNNGDLVAYFGLDRFDNSGSAQVGFWFLQDPTFGLTTTPSASSFKFSGAHRDGDVLVQSNFTQGGTIDTVTVFKWQAGALVQVASEGDCATTLPGALACATVNRGNTPAPWPYTPKSGPSGTFPQGTFFEGGINISGLIGDSCFARFVAETRSSTPFTSTLKDFTIGNFNTCSLSLPNQATVTSTNAALDNGGVSNKVTITVTAPGGSSSVASLGIGTVPEPLTVSSPSLTDTTATSAPASSSTAGAAALSADAVDRLLLVGDLTTLFATPQKKKSIGLFS